MCFCSLHALRQPLSASLPLSTPNTTDDDGTAAGTQGAGADEEDGEGGDKVEEDVGLLRPYTDVPWHRKGGLVTVTTGGGAGQVRKGDGGRMGEEEGSFCADIHTSSPISPKPPFSLSLLPLFLFASRPPPVETCHHHQDGPDLPPSPPAAAQRAPGFLRFAGTDQGGARGPAEGHQDRLQHGR